LKVKVTPNNLQNPAAYEWDNAENFGWKRGQKMKDDVLNLISIDELWSLHEQVELVLSSRIAREKAVLEKRLNKLKAASSSREAARRPYPPVVPKFRNPVRPSETWAGRGKQPRWLSAQLRSGKKLDDFRIRVS
jgi:DNA-binding protein H-NS